MIPIVDAGQSNRAILLMLTAIVSFTVMDASVKAVAAEVGVLPALWARYAGQMLVVLVIFSPNLRQIVKTRYPRLQIARSVLLMSATACFFSGLALIPFASAAALMALNPVLITLGAALFLGEALGPRRIAGIGAALVGAMIIIRPGGAIFEPGALLPLGAAVCYSGYALLTRRVGSDEDVRTSLFYTGLVGTILLSLAVPLAWQMPGDATGWLLLIMVAGFGTFGQLCLIRAFSLGEAAMLAPYAYVGLIFATLWGMIFFDEWPDRWTVTGALVIAGAGLYVWHRETRR
jgi:drug/metabolite transporter (DMT)-like permease